MEDGHGPQLTLQGRGAAPPGVLCACKGGADAALLQGGHQPSPPAKPCGGGDRLGAGKGGVSGSQGSGDWWRRQPRGGGRCAVPSRADTAGGERLRGQGWGSGQITAKLRVPPTSSSSPRPYRPQRLKSEAYMGGGGVRNTGAPGLTLSKMPQLPRASPNPAWHTSLREGQRRGAVLTSWPSL